MPAIPTAPRQRTHQKENGSSGHTEQRSYQEALQRPLHQFKIIQPTESPTPMIGPISGEMSMAPIITAVEFTFNPNEAMNMANIRIKDWLLWIPLPYGWNLQFQFIVLVFAQIKIVFQKSFDSKGISVVRIHDIYNLTIYYSVVYFFINQLMTGMLPRHITPHDIGHKRPATKRYGTPYAGRYFLSGHILQPDESTAAKQHITTDSLQVILNGILLLPYEIGQKHGDAIATESCPAQAI